MRYQQKEKIRLMRGEGFSYARIAAELGILENTVKSFCRRNNLGGVSTGIAKQRDRSLCRQCKTPLTHTVGAKQKLFCSDKCRMSWWNTHPEALRRNAIYAFICAHCGDTFESYGNKKRKYCSRACYGKSKAVARE